uniref:Superoxide dismutase copper chaperone n=1 Tax=Phallusia mammillata TaxID=59560 RepID=A0A6F9D8X7_9ASCI|nr:copper chaperone for superoxide dismutase-like [Phallusia mammillata]
MSVNIQMEFAVEMSCEACSDSITKVLKEKSVKVLDIDLDKQMVLVETNKPFQNIQETIESTGKRAALMGLGSSVGGKHLGAAVAEISGTKVRGVVRMLQLDEQNCLFEGTLDGLSPGEHGLNIHEFGDLSNGCVNCGEHYNPHGRQHGGRNKSERHVGDLGNISAEKNGRSVFRFVDDQVKVWDIIGRSMVVHEKADDLGQGQYDSSKQHGNSGQGLACGIVARSAGLMQNVKRVCACDGIVLWDERNVPAAGVERSQFMQKL